MRAHAVLLTLLLAGVAFGEVEQPSLYDETLSLPDRTIKLTWGRASTGDPPTGYRWQMFRCTAHTQAGSNRCNEGYELQAKADNYMASTACTSGDSADRCTQTWNVGTRVVPVH